jgi:hypothetical protein
MHSDPLLILKSAIPSDAQMRKWKVWEKETQTLDHEFSNGEFFWCFIQLGWSGRVFLPASGYFLVEK